MDAPQSKALARTRQAWELELEEGITRASSPYSASILQGLTQLEEAYRALALFSFLSDGDIDGFFHHMSLSAAARVRLLSSVARGMPCPPSVLRAADTTALFTALASGERRVLAELAKNELSLKVAAEDPKHEIAFGRALRLVTTGRYAEAREPFMRFARSRTPEDTARAMILAGLLKSDEARFNDGLGRFIEATPPRRGEARLSIEALGFARLGQSVGLAITVVDPAIPEELLEPAEAPYPDPKAILPPVEGEIIEIHGGAWS